METNKQLSEEFSLELIIVVVQELVDQLSILKKINNWPDAKQDDFRFISLEERFSETVFNNQVPVKNLLTENFNSIAVIASRLLEELKNEKSYAKFSEIVSTLKKMKFEEENLLKEAKNKENVVKRLKTVVDNEQMAYIERIIKSMADIGLIKDQIENFQIESEIKLNYVKDFQNSKFEMKDIKSTNSIKEEIERIQTTKTKIDQDIRVNKEIKAAMDEMIKELEGKVEEWKIKYNEKLKEMNGILDVLHGKHNKQLEIIANFKELFSKHQKEIDDYKQYKIEQEILRKEKEKRNKAATKIQAWWRGTMVRKGFGKFRKKKEKKGKKKSSENKEKK